MSEYQYYEFQAIDRPLTKSEQEMLRGLSSRAHITATSFTNHYEWGSFKGDPKHLMESCFDLHLYCANLGNAAADDASAQTPHRSSRAWRVPR
jgi:hypothetical protein